MIIWSDTRMVAGIWWAWPHLAPGAPSPASLTSLWGSQATPPGSEKSSTTTRASRDDVELSHHHHHHNHRLVQRSHRQLQARPEMRSWAFLLFIYYNYNYHLWYDVLNCFIYESFIVCDTESFICLWYWINMFWQQVLYLITIIEFSGCVVFQLWLDDWPLHNNRDFFPPLVPLKWLK